MGEDTKPAIPTPSRRRRLIYNDEYANAYYNNYDDDDFLGFVKNLAHAATGGIFRQNQQPMYGQQGMMGGMGGGMNPAMMRLIQKQHQHRMNPMNQMMPMMMQMMMMKMIMNMMHDNDAKNNDQTQSFEGYLKEKYSDINMNTYSAETQ